MMGANIGHDGTRSIDKDQIQGMAQRRRKLAYADDEVREGMDEIAKPGSTTDAAASIAVGPRAPANVRNATLQF